MSNEPDRDKVPSIHAPGIGECRNLEIRRMLTSQEVRPRSLRLEQVSLGHDQ